METHRLLLVTNTIQLLRCLDQIWGWVLKVHMHIAKKRKGWNEKGGLVENWTSDILREMHFCMANTWTLPMPYIRTFRWTCVCNAVHHPNRFTCVRTFSFKICAVRMSIFTSTSYFFNWLGVCILMSLSWFKFDMLNLACWHIYIQVVVVVGIAHRLKDSCNFLWKNK